MAIKFSDFGIEDALVVEALKEIVSEINKINSILQTTTEVAETGLQRDVDEAISGNWSFDNVNGANFRFSPTIYSRIRKAQFQTVFDFGVGKSAEVVWWENVGQFNIYGGGWLRIYSSEIHTGSSVELRQVATGGQVSTSSGDIILGPKSANHGRVNADIIATVKTATTAQLNNLSHAINTVAAKVVGASVFNTDTSKPVWALGDTDAAAWVDATGTTVHTPV